MAVVDHSLEMHDLTGDKSLIRQRALDLDGPFSRGSFMADCKARDAHTQQKAANGSGLHALAFLRASARLRGRFWIFLVRVHPRKFVARFGLFPITRDDGRSRAMAAIPTPARSSESGPETADRCVSHPASARH